jgi:E3 ubiquitin-protein ligase DOA10
MIDEESPLIEIPCRICTDHIEDPYQYCECKDDLYFHKQCMETWLNKSNTLNCDVCKTDLKVVKKYNYKKFILTKLIFIPVFVIICFLLYFFIRDDLKELYQKNKSSIILVSLFGLYLIYEFIFKHTSCKIEYNLLLSE